MVILFKVHLLLKETIHSDALFQFCVLVFWNVHSSQMVFLFSQCIWFEDIFHLWWKLAHGFSRKCLLYLKFFFLIWTTDKPKATLKADQTDIPVGGSVTLTCSVEGSSGWKYYWYQHNTHSLIIQHGVQYSTGPISVSEGGTYWCRGGRGDPVYYTEHSDPLTIGITGGAYTIVWEVLIIIS